MKRKILFGCLCCTLLSAACERLDNDRTLHVREDDSPFTLEDVAKLLSCVPLGNAQMEEVRDAVSSSSDNGYDTEYTMRDLFETPGAGVGDAEGTRVETYTEPLRDLIAAEVRRQFGTRGLDAEGFLDALSASDVQIYWPFPESSGSTGQPVITFDPGDNSVRNVGWIRKDDGTVGEIIVDEETARSRPVWVVNRNADAEFKSLEMLRREDPSWGQGGGEIIIGTRAVKKDDFKTLVLSSIQVNRQFDSWFCGASEIWVKCGAVEDFTATTEAELRLYNPSVTDFLIVVRRNQVGEKIPFNAVLVSEWTGMLDNCAFMMTEDDGGTRTTWKCSAMVRYNSKSYGFEIEIPLHSRDDIIWRGALTRTYIERNSGYIGHFGDVDLVLDLI